MLPKPHAQRHAEGPDRAEQTEQHIEAARHVQRLDDARDAGDQTADHRANHHRLPAGTLPVHLHRQREGDHFIRRRGAIRAAHGTGDRGTHPSTHRLNVEGVALTATALNLNRYHNCLRVKVGGAAFPIA